MPVHMFQQSGIYLRGPEQKSVYLPQLKVDVHASIIDRVAETKIRQTFTNPHTEKTLEEAKYIFPLYDGVSVISFRCTIGDKTIVGRVQERLQARQVYKEAVKKGEVAGLLEQSEHSADLFTANIGNIPPSAEVKVEIVHVGELKSDIQEESIRYTLPTTIAPRYGNFPGEVLTANHLADGGLSVTLDAHFPTKSSIKTIESPSHPLSVSVGTLSTDAEKVSQAFNKAHASLTLKTVQLEKDCVFLIQATNLDQPAAILEKHPHDDSSTIMASLVPRFNLPQETPEIVFVCDRSGSMAGSDKIGNLISALNILVKSLPNGLRFNIVSFGSRFSSLWPRSQPYNSENLDTASRHISKFDADMGGTEILEPLEHAIEKRYTDSNLEIILLTDGEVWQQDTLIQAIQKHVDDSNNAIRVFTLGVGEGVSHSLVDGLARAGNGFSQIISEGERISKKMVRTLKAALSTHINDYHLEVEFAGEEEGFEFIDQFESNLTLEVAASSEADEKSKSHGSVSDAKPISLYDESAPKDDTIISPSDHELFKNVPIVPVPRILQSPSRIPALYVYNRTNAYLMLSGPLSHRAVKSVHLRATSKHGPLSLEIPVDTLSEKGERIHQLAARKSVQELENGSGWITLAKDTDGTLLSKKYDAKYQDMVQREAIRLCVKYQIGGKWCSFVAVEETKDGKASDRKPVPTYSLKADEHTESFGAVQFSSVRPKAAMLGASSFAPMMRSVAPAAVRTTVGASPSMQLARRSVSESEDLIDYSDEQSVEEPSSASGSSPLDILVSKQSFDGSWDLSPDVLNVLQVDKEVVLQSFQNQFSVADQQVIATALVLSYLTSKLDDEADSWELLADKARSWLTGKAGDEHVSRDWESLAKTLL